MRPLLLSLLLLLATHTHGQTTAWDNARAAYDTGDFQRAASLYQNLREQGPTSPALEYNLANTLFRLGHVEASLAAYRRAQWLSPNDPDLLANFQRVATLARVEIPPLPLSRRLASALSLPNWQRLWFATCWILAAAGILRRTSPRFRIATPWLLPLLFSLLLLSIAGLFASKPSGLLHEAVLQGETITARFEPLDDATPRFALPGGSIVTRLQTTRDWTLIQSNQNQGWVPTKALLPL